MTTAGKVVVLALVAAAVLVVATIVSDAQAGDWRTAAAGAIGLTLSTATVGGATYLIITI